MVDDSDDNKTRQLIRKFENSLSQKGIQSRYLRPPRDGMESISRARNIGALEATCDIVIFLDDDVIIEDNYVEEILKFFDIYPEALGVQGIVAKLNPQRGKKRFVRAQNLLCKMFYLSYEEECGLKILPSGNPTILMRNRNLRKVIPSEWLSGTNCAYRKKTLREFRFDEKLLKYSFGEDKELSYRIQKRHPKSLFITPHARVFHKASPKAKRCPDTQIFIETAYPIYFFYNNIEQTLSNKVIFLWSLLGHPLLTLKSLISRAGLKGVYLLLKSYLWTVKHINEVKEGKFSFLRTC